MINTADKRNFLLIELAGPVVSAGIGDETGKINFFRKSSAILKSGARGATLQILRLCDQVLSDTKVPVQQLEKIIVNYDGPVDFKSQKIIHSEQVKGWEDFPLCRHLSDQYRLPAIIDNKVNLAALGEHTFGNGQDIQDFLYVDFGDAIGGALVLNGALWRGEGQMAGGISHQVVKPHGRSCTCGKRGCLNMYSSGSAIANAAREEIDSNPYETSTILDLAAGRTMAISADTIFLAAKQGDPLSRRILDEAIRYLGITIANVLSLLDIKTVIVGGRLAGVGDQLLEPLHSYIDEFSATPSRDGLVIVQSKIRENPAFEDAIALALTKTSP